jgi:hypothetical protein
MDDQEAYRRLADLFRAVDRWGEDREQSVAIQPGSRLDADDRLTAPYQISHSIAISIGCARDHLHALRTLVVDGNALHMAAPFTLTRAALENAAQALWLLTPAEQAQRVTRRLQMCVRDARERHEAGLLLGEPRGDADLQERLARFAELAQAAGLDPGVIRKRAPGWGRMVRDAAEPAGLAGERIEALWRLGSGFAHGQSWSMLTSSSLDLLAGTEGADAVLEYRVTADVPTVWTLASAATLVLNQALTLRERHRKYWVGSSAKST